MKKNGKAETFGYELEDADLRLLKFWKNYHAMHAAHRLIMARNTLITYPRVLGRQRRPRWSR